MKSVFSYLDTEGKRYLTLEEFVEIYEHQVKIVEINSEALMEQQKKELEKRKKLIEDSTELEVEARSYYETKVDRTNLTRVEYLTKLSSTNVGEYQSQADEKLKANLLSKLETIHPSPLTLAA